MATATRLGPFLLAATLALTACTGGSDDKDADDGASPSPSSTDTSTAAPAADPDWSTLGVHEDALPENPVVDVVDNVAAVGKQPMLYVGSVAAPGEPSRATVWRVTDKGLGDDQALDVGGSHSYVNDVGAGSGNTVIVGGAWEGGGSTPFALTSRDRKSWSAMPVPDELTEREVPLAEVVVDAEGVAWAAGVDAEHVAVAVNLSSGEVVDLPAYKKAELRDVYDIAVVGKNLVALVEALQVDGGQTTVAYVSKDGGATWQAARELPGEETWVAGMVQHDGTLVATGQRQAGTDIVPTSWTSSNGTSWKQEPVPQVAEHHEGWAAWLQAPVVVQGNVYAPLVDGEKLFGTILRRTSSGWTHVGKLPNWAGPGAVVNIGSNGKQIAVVRDGYGQMQTSRMTTGGAWTATGTQPSMVAPVNWVDSLGLDGDVPVLVGGRTNVLLRGGDSWSRVTDLTRFAVREEGLKPLAWSPKTASGLSGSQILADDKGRTVLIGERLRPGTGEADGSGLVGWVREKNKPWKVVTGLAGPRSEFLSSIVHLGNQWVVVGSDRDSFVGSAHTRGAVWVSKDGATWKRQKGPFDVSPTLDSDLDGACRLPGGDLLVVGAVENPGTGSAPLAFRRTKGAWKRVNLSGLGGGATSLSSCAGVGDEVVLQGRAQADKAWKTVDGKKFEAIEIGTEDDVVEAIVALDQGYAAPGTVRRGSTTRAVVWLSKDGSTWRAVDVPTDRPMSGSHVLAWGDRLLVSLSASSGPALAVLENPAELIEAS